MSRKARTVAVATLPPEPRRFGIDLSGPKDASLFLVDVDDGGAHEIAADHFVAASWSPDGSQIAAINFPSARDLVLLNADGTGRQTLVQINDSGPSGRKSYLFTGVVWHPVPAP